MRIERSLPSLVSGGLRRRISLNLNFVFVGRLSKTKGKRPREEKVQKPPRKKDDEEEVGPSTTETVAETVDEEATPVIATAPLEERQPKRQKKQKCSERQLTLEDTDDMIYTQKVIDETHKLVNVPPMLFRTVLQDVDFSGKFRVEDCDV
ncbi:hypothetical protein R1sor_012072 [Riccia sorocarpa]|uniref:Uncharacterized protein n=1 Tax=Riccia sorocarpa TaxID=122646 RepID=A0ABD3I413_9MARC